MNRRIFTIVKATILKFAVGNRNLLVLEYQVVKNYLSSLLAATLIGRPWHSKKK